MLTFFTIDKAQSPIFPIRSKINTEEKSVGGVDVRLIRCVHRRGRLPFEKIRRLSGNQSDCLLTKEDLVLPRDSGLRRFYSTELFSRLCLNMAAEILNGLHKAAQEVKVAVYDPEAAVADGVGVLLKFTKSLTAVTRMTGIYKVEAERIMEESGAVLKVSKQMKSLENAKLIIVPQKLKTLLPVSRDAVILTVSPPAVSQKGAVYYKYFFTPTDELKKLCPEGFESSYVASALYTLLGRFDLGSVVPLAVKGDFGTQTLVSLNKYLMNIGSNP